MEFLSPTPETVSISLGRGCHTAMHLDMLNIRKFSYPMDWIVPYGNNSDPETRFEFLINGFKNFFNKEDLVLTDIKNAFSNHRIVYNNYTGLSFVHDFPLDRSVDKAFVEIKKKYARRSKRVINHIKKAKNIYLFYMTNTWDHAHEIDYEYPDASWKVLMYRLCKKYPNKNFQLLIFSHDENFEKLDYKKHQISANIIKYTSNHKYTKNDEKCGMILSIEKAVTDRFEIDPVHGIVADNSY